MEVRTFRAATLQEALQQVRESLGPDASVLHTRERRGSRLGLFRKPVIEVEASVDVPVASRFEISSRLPLSETRAGAHTSSRSAPADVASQRAAAEIQDSSFPTASPPTTQSAEPQPSERRGSQGTLTPAMFDVLSDMLDAGVEPQLAKALMTQVYEECDEPQRHDAWLVHGKISQIIASWVTTSGAIQIDKDEQRVVALVGPTGVGKTTTLAKIAAGFRFDLGCQIGLITLDTFRLGAVDQLLQYAELISAPLEVVSSPDQVTGALQRLRECDLVLLDTAGRSPKDAEQLAVLADFLRAAQPDATHLVVSATSSRGHVRETLKQFAALDPTNLLITKLDEAVAVGEWLSILKNSSLPISYLTAGQHVPQDIVIATPRRLAGLMVGHGQPPPVAAALTPHA